MNARSVVLSGVGVALLAACQAMGAVALPCFSDFDSDTVGMEPGLGGAHQPTGYLLADGSEPLPVVRASALGIVTQPIEFAMQPGEDTGALLVYDFEPNVETMVVRAEATLSLSDYTHVMVMRAWQGTTGLVLGSVYVSPSGSVAGAGAMLGTYVPGEPMRIRIDVDISAGTVAMTLDDEMNGFGDDVRHEGAVYSEGATNCGGIGIGYRNSTDEVAQGTTVAFDDVRILSLIPAPGVWMLPAVAGVAAAWRRRR